MYYFKYGAIAKKWEPLPDEIVAPRIHFMMPSETELRSASSDVDFEKYRKPASFVILYRSLRVWPQMHAFHLGT